VAAQAGFMIRQWYNNFAAQMPGTLFVVATPIGNLEDITLRALRVLREVAVIAAEDTRRTAHLLARHAISTPTTSLHEHNEAAKSPSLIDRLMRGEDVALVSDAGAPTISDPGAHLINEAIGANVRVVPIPGPSAPVAAVSVSGFAADAFTFLGFPPTKATDRIEWFNQLIASHGIVVFFEAPHRIKATLAELKRMAGDCEVLVTRELTKIHEELVRGPISEVLTRLLEPQGEFTVVAKIGLEANFKPSAPPVARELAREFGELTAIPAISRRKAIAELARRHGLTANAVYEALESAKKCVE
jgi:16S rRNA (cytidine1402-2'-O)-methyltransferase